MGSKITSGPGKFAPPSRQACPRLFTKGNNGDENSLQIYKKDPFFTFQVLLTLFPHYVHRYTGTVLVNPIVSKICSA